MSDEKTARISFSGDLDVYRREEIAAALPSPESTDRLVIDLREATIIDSSILAILMRYRRTFVDAGRDPHEIVIIVHPQLRRIFEITGLMKSLTIVSASSETGTAGTAAAEPMSEA